MNAQEIIEKIRAEVNRQARSIDTATGDFAEGRRMEQRIILSVLSDLEKECSIPNDLEDAAKLHRSNAIYGGDINLAMEDSYKKGAKWQKEQMMKEAVEGFVICYNDDTYSVESCCFDNKEHHHHSGDKVRIIIVKED